MTAISYLPKVTCPYLTQHTYTARFDLPDRSAALIVIMRTFSTSRSRHAVLRICFRDTQLRSCNPRLLCVQSRNPKTQAKGPRVGLVVTSRLIMSLIVGR